MPKKQDFDSTFELLSKVVKAGRVEKNLLSPEKMERVLDAYRGAAKQSEVTKEIATSKTRDGNLELSSDEIKPLRLGDMRRLLESRELRSINGVLCDDLEREFEETRTISDDERALQAVKEHLERAPGEESRHKQHLGKLRKSEKEKLVKSDGRLRIVREQKRNR